MATVTSNGSIRDALTPLSRASIYAENADMAQLLFQHALKLDEQRGDRHRRSAQVLCPLFDAKSVRSAPPSSSLASCLPQHQPVLRSRGYYSRGICGLTRPDGPTRSLTGIRQWVQYE